MESADEYNQLFSKETEPESLTLDFSLEDEEITGLNTTRPRQRGKPLLCFKFNYTQIYTQILEYA